MKATNHESVFETDRLRLEPQRESHAAELFAILSDPRLYEFIPQDPPQTLAVLAARFQRLETRISPSGDEIWLNWVVRSKSEKKCLGRVQATIRQDGSALIAYEIGTAFWGQGYAVEACGRVIQALFADYQADQIVADVDTRNLASIRLLERLGFQLSAHRPNADFFKGSISHEFIYTLPRPPAKGND